jgi:hypothetical protein
MNSDAGPREEDHPVAVEISDNMLRVTLRDGRIIATGIPVWQTLPRNSNPIMSWVSRASIGPIWMKICRWAACCAESVHLKIVVRHRLEYE